MDFFHQGRVNRMKAQKLIKAQVVRVWQRGAEEKMRISKWCLRVFLSCLSIEKGLRLCENKSRIVMVTRSYMNLLVA